MANSFIAVPEFTTDESTPVRTGMKEVEESSTEATGEELVEKETGTPSEPPAEEKLEEEAQKVEPQPVDTGTLEHELEALKREKSDLIKQVIDLRGQRRELVDQGKSTVVVDQKVEDLKDIHPDDAALIEKYVRAKGYVTKDEMHKVYYDNVKNEVLNAFLEKFPEYKPENDPHDLKWSTLSKEMGLYRMPENPHQISELLQRAHSSVSGSATGGRRSLASTEVQRRQVQTAGVGSGGTQRPSSRGGTLEPSRRAMLERGGWSEEEIKKIEKNLID